MDTKNDAADATEGKSARSLPKFPTARILVVDDEPQIREICRRTLERRGFVVKTAETGDQALTILKDQKFDFLLTDIMMPGSVDGVGLVEEAKHICPAMDVVIMTGYPTVDTAVRAMKQGASDYLLKPFSPAYLECVVTRNFEKRSLAKELDRENLMRNEFETAFLDLQKLQRLQADFLGKLQHDLRTPLMNILELSGTSQMRKMVEHMLRFCDADTKEIQLGRVSVRLEELVKALVEAQRSLWEEKELKVEVSFARPVAPVWGDAELLNTAFKHLLLNAIHFSNKGAVIRIEGTQKAGEASVTIQNTGVEAPVHEVSKVFDRFYQVGEHMTQTVGGLGRALVRKILKAHGGEVTVDTGDSVGSVCTVRLPISADCSKPECAGAA